MLEIRTWNGEVSKSLIALSAVLMFAVTCQYIDFNVFDEKCFEPVYFLLTQTAKIDFAEKHRLHLWFGAILPKRPRASDW